MIPQPVSDHILIEISSAPTSKKNPATTVITTYCPANAADEDIIEGHYDNLKRAIIDSIPAHNVLLAGGW